MGCLSHRKKQTEEFADQRWEYINLKDFRSAGCGTIFAYIYLWLMLFVSVAVYAVDSFTAVNLLAFNRWSGGIDPAIEIDISKWIFSVCIILSFLNLGYEGFRAFRVIKRGNIAECYLDSLAVRWESIRMGSGQGFRRFLVFAELTKSKKGAEYIALFTYFSFQSWIRVIICSAPRQVVNAFTIKAVYDAKLTVSSKSVGGSITAFFEKIKDLAEDDYRQALTLCGMCFTLIIWVFSALFLLAAVLFWVFFLWHWIPSTDDGLSGYCRRRVTKTLMKIVTKKVNKALAIQGANFVRADGGKNANTGPGGKIVKKTSEKPPMGRAPTLPLLPNVSPAGDDKMPEMPSLGRSETMATLPVYSSRPGTPGGMEMSNMEKKRPVPSRMGTGMSNTSYSSRAPLVAGASEMGYGRSPSPTQTYQGTSMSNNMPSAYGDNGPQQPLRPMLSNSTRNRFNETPAPMYDDNRPYPPPQRSATARPMDNFGPPNDAMRYGTPPLRSATARPMDNFGPSNDAMRYGTPPPRAATARPLNNFGPSNDAMRYGTPPPRAATTGPMHNSYGSNEGLPYVPSPLAPTVQTNNLPLAGDSFSQSPMNTSPQREYEAYNPDGRVSPAPTVNSYSSGPQRPMNPPVRSATGPMPPRGLQSAPQRTMTAPPANSLSPVGEHGERDSMTSSVMSSSVAPPPRSGSVAPSIVPSSVTLPSAPTSMRSSPAPRLGPSPGPRSPTEYSQQGYDPGYDVESQRGRGNWNQ